MAWLVATPASAEPLDNAAIKKLMLDAKYGQVLYIRLDKHQTSPTECHINGAWEYVVDISTPLGEKFYSNLLTLYASGRPARFDGNGQCNFHDGIETLRRVELM